MKIFRCGHCDHALFFENYVCENCGHLSGYRDGDRLMLTFDPAAPDLTSDREDLAYKFCKNKEYEVCNWLIEADSAEEFCTACRLNRTIPNLADRQNFGKWKSLEVAKHRLVYQLQKLGLPVPSKLTHPDEGLCFDFVEQYGNLNLMTGHADGVVTILLTEADSVLREQMRKQFGEPYRTLIGHLRHEVGHYFWDRLIRDRPEALERFRAAFGDERADYSEALQTYYREGVDPDWQGSHISRYSTAHPWEDWAETWAHYLHIVDMVETSFYFGVRIAPRESERAMAAEVSFDPYFENDFGRIVETSVPLSYAVNSINRAMGIADVYPFVISPAVREKLTFIHELLLPLRGDRSVGAS